MLDVMAILNVILRYLAIKIVELFVRVKILTPKLSKMSLLAIIIRLALKLMIKRIALSKTIILAKIYLK